MTASFVAAALWTADTPSAVVVATMFVTGVGMGAVTIPLLTMIQNHFGAARMGATASQQFFRNLGGTIGVSLLGFVMTLAMRERLDRVPGVSNLGDLRERLLGGGRAGEALLPVLLEGLTWTFAVSVVVCAVAAVALYALPSLGSEPPAPAANDD
ncbi:hypothetical protein [Halegenticoccus tardaugens]|uniref:hypothetical protein n=1 Tax=Halegenticoccus tardaugens TaxID=2071624 RepID=UPI00100B27E5|nr:hypothetical protein [Halegenticoccus tardaugens]